jgi:hypothetical protein
MPFAPAIVVPHFGCQFALNGTGLSVAALRAFEAIHAKNRVTSWQPTTGQDAGLVSAGNKGASAPRIADCINAPAYCRPHQCVCEDANSCACSAQRILVVRAACGAV